MIGLVVWCVALAAQIPLIQERDSILESLCAQLLRPLVDEELIWVESY